MGDQEVAAQHRGTPISIVHSMNVPHEPNPPARVEQAIPQRDHR
jgi:hypothetical protein